MVPELHHRGGGLQRRGGRWRNQRTGAQQHAFLPELSQRRPDGERGALPGADSAGGGAEATRLRAKKNAEGGNHYADERTRGGGNARRNPAAGWPDAGGSNRGL